GDGEVLSAPVIPGLEDGGELFSQVATLAEDEEAQSNDDVSTDTGYITVYFDYNDESDGYERHIETITVSSDSDILEVIYSLPKYTPNVDENYYLWDWTYTDGDKTIVATVDTALMDGMTFTAVYQEAYRVYCYDVWPDGTDGTESGDITVDGDEGSDVTVDDGEADSGDADDRYWIDLLVPVNMTLQEYFNTYDDPTWDDGTHFSDCVWRDEDGNRVSLSTAVTEDMELYTYSYQIVLTLDPNSTETAIASYSMVEVTDGGNGVLTLTITAREGETLKASDFVVDGVDYSLYVWTDDDGYTVDLQSLIGTSLTQNYTAYSNETLTNTRPIEITFFVCVDDVWQSTTQTMTAYWLTESGDGVSNNSWFLTSAQLQSVYGKYGFAGLTAGQYIFPHATSGASTTLWSDRASQKVDNIVYSPIINSSADSCYVYYLPKGEYNSSGQSRANLAAANTFYSVTVTDPDQLIYSDDMVSYTLKGGTAEVTVSTQDDVSWQYVGLYGNSDQVTKVENGDTVTFTIEGITQPYVLSPVHNTDTMITYVINLPQTPADTEYGTPQIEGGSTYTVVANGSHTVLAPSLLSYFYNSGKYLGEATFLGWAVNGNTNTDDLLQPGATLDLSDYGGQTVMLVRLLSLLRLMNNGPSAIFLLA
ncbi:MAG: hypothetical protein ACI4O7_04950, partial [Aristaeellaceae bacterium]